MKIRKPLFALSLGLAATLHALPASAQSSYVLSKLSAPFLGRLSTASCIDDSHQVFGEAQYYRRTVFSWTAPGFVTEYYDRAVRWPASKASSVSPVKLSERGGISHYSSRCGKLAAQGILVNLATGQETVLPTGNGQPNWTGAKPNEAGVVLWDAGTWTQAGGTVALPSGGHARIGTIGGINNRGDVAGYVDADEQGQSRAAVWLDRQLQVIDPRPDVISVAEAINDQRQVVIKSYPRFPTTSPDVTSSLARWHNGVLTPLLPAGDTRFMAEPVINNRGVIMGCVGPSGSQTCHWGTGRAFIWREGVLQDLTDLVRAKGAALPSGAVLIAVQALNDAGSFVARMRTPNAQDTVVRLTAVP